MRKKLSYLGPPFTYSEKAAMQFASQLDDKVEIFHLESAEAVARSLISQDQNKADYAVIPYYNFLEGLVQECLDLIYEYHLHIFESQRVAIKLALGKHPNGPNSGAVYSHAKAVAQCSEYLWQHYREHRQIPVSSTAEAARMVKTSQLGLAIASKEALQHCGLEIIAESIGNKRHGKENFTDFYLLSNCDNETFDSNQSYSTMIAVTPQLDRPGLLAEILGQVAYYGLNNAKIHSRPAIDEVSLNVEPQMFYLEIVSHKNHPDFRKCIDALRYRLTPTGTTTEVVRVLGSYQRPGIKPN